MPGRTDREILALRPARNAVDPWRASARLIESEFSADGELVDVATLFLTNRECPFRCVMCDLWKNTTLERVPRGAIPRQIEQALQELPPARQIKLYNAGSFFDPQAIPPEDFPAIAALVQPFERVIVENHPRFCGPACLEFSRLLSGQLEVAIGLETVHPDVLPALNKQMTLEDFARAVDFLRSNGINVRAFILLRPPFLSASTAEEWALRSLEYAFAQGVECSVVIPTRGGNGIMEQLAQSGDFQPPSLEQLEAVLEQGLQLQRGRVFADLWDLDRLAGCPACHVARVSRMREMNDTQRVPDPVRCAVCGA